MIVYTATYHFQKLRRWYERYERFLIPGALLMGVITDAVMFKTLNLNLVFTILTVHFIVSGAVIAFIYLYDANYLRVKGARFLRLFAPLILQYTFGALLSAFLIFYWFSSSFAASWPFILIIVFLMLSNDLLKRYYLWLSVRMGVYFFITFSLSVLMLPFLTGKMGALIFIAGGLLSLVIIIVYLYALSFVVPGIREQKGRFMAIVGVLFVGMNVLYFLNVIPPVPLSLREAGVFHFVERVEGEYRVLSEEQDLWERLRPGTRVHMQEGQRVYFFTAIFAPTRLETEVVHHWQYYDPDQGRWISRGRTQYPIVGGRDGGYRGYSVRSNVFPGRWRVSVETKRGQVIGRETFRVVGVDRTPDLQEEVR